MNLDTSSATCKMNHEILDIKTGKRGLLFLPAKIFRGKPESKDQSENPGYEWRKELSPGIPGIRIRPWNTRVGEG